jgi:MoaA/NifB/PqqE/SkfB family radical SAM enzyme
MKILERIVRHARITRKAYQKPASPPFLILFINSICNMKCEHCFYWESLNRRDDLTKDEIFALSDSLGQIENLNLSGGEPFLRKEFSEICRRFIQRNKVRQIYVPTNGWYTDKIVHEVTATLKEGALELIAIELSLDGMAEFHDKFRVAPGSFDRAMRTYDALVEVQSKDPRLRIHAISTATEVNMDEIQCLTTYLFDRCPKMDHHNLAIIRGDRKNRSLQGPNLQRYQELYSYVRRLWMPRETGRYGSIVEPMLQWAKVQTVQRQTQVIPCLAGKLSAVVYANGDVSVCEIHKPLGNLRQKSFWEIWNSADAQTLRQSIARKDCYCTTEVFLWPSIVFQPARLAQAMLGAKVWQKPGALRPDEKVHIDIPVGPVPQVTVAPDKLKIP